MRRLLRNSIAAFQDYGMLEKEEYSMAVSVTAML